MQGALGLTAISDWIPGFATFYGGEPDGMDPYSPSYGTSVVRPNTHIEPRFANAAPLPQMHQLYHTFQESRFHMV